MPLLAQVVGKTYCGFTKRAKAALADMGLQPATLDLDTMPNGDAMQVRCASAVAPPLCADTASAQAAFASITGIKTVPQVFIGGDCLGGCDDTLRAISDGSIKQKLSAAGMSTGA